MKIRRSLVAVLAASLLVACSGEKGTAGPQGEQGIPGAQGLKGDKGDTGDIGPQGAPGLQGPRGLSWRGAWDAATTYAVDDAVEHGGSAYMAVASSTGSPPPASDWQLLAAKGDAGAQGIQGSQGPKGDKGDTGASGPTGSPGTSVAGLSLGPGDPHCPFGGTEFISASGADYACNGADGAQGPQGPAGDTGAQGPPGAVGAAGPPGLDWRGSWDMSALYVTRDVVEHQGSSFVAVAANTESEPGVSGDWQLVAAAGAVGPTGAPGIQGPQGPQGDAGPPGPAGIGMAFAQTTFRNVYVASSSGAYATLSFNAPSSGYILATASGQCSPYWNGYLDYTIGLASSPSESPIPEAFTFNVKNLLMSGTPGYFPATFTLERLIPVSPGPVSIPLKIAFGGYIGVCSGSLSARFGISLLE